MIAHVPHHYAESEIRIHIVKPQVLNKPQEASTFRKITEELSKGNGKSGELQKSRNGQECQMSLTLQGSDFCTEADTTEITIKK